MLIELSKEGITGNQFQIGDGARVIGAEVNEDGSIKNLNFFDAERLKVNNTLARHTTSKGNPALRRTYVQPKGNTKEEVESNIKDIKKRVREAQRAKEKPSQQIRIGNYNSRLPKFKTNDKVLVDGNKKGVIVQLTKINNNPETRLSAKISYIIRLDNNKQLMISQDRISKDV